MNNRDYKNFAPGEYYHIYNRGNGKMDIFKSDEDYKLFLFRLKENILRHNLPDGDHLGEMKAHTIYVRQILPANSFELVCYCLMPNHFHLIIKQLGDVSISKLISKICTSYSKNFNKKYNHIGSLFQDSFKAILIDNDNYLLWLSAYIHQNPKVASLVKNSSDWQWSSYPDFIGIRNGVLCQKGIIMDHFKNINEYKNFVESSFEIIKNKKGELEDLFMD